MSADVEIHVKFWLLIASRKIFGQFSFKKKNPPAFTHLWAVLSPVNICLFIVLNFDFYDREWEGESERGESKLKQGLWTKSSVLAALLSYKRAPFRLLVFAHLHGSVGSPRTQQLLYRPAGGSLSKEMPHEAGWLMFGWVFSRWRSLPGGQSGSLGDTGGSQFYNTAVNLKIWVWFMHLFRLLCKNFFHHPKHFACSISKLQAFWFLTFSNYTFIAPLNPTSC